MKEWDFNEELALRRKRLIKTGYDAYCLFGLSGNEIKLANELNRLYEDCLALPFMRMVHKSRNGEKFMEQDAILKGYVFLYLPCETEIASIKIINCAFRILKREDERTALSGVDRHYAEWILSLGGLIGLSKALRIGENVKIIEGPLLDVEGSIVKYSKKNRNCLVEINIVGRQLSIWLPFDWVRSTGAAGGVYEGDKELE